MENHIHTITLLFDQLGLNSSDAEINKFVTKNSPLSKDVELYKAKFWNSSQAICLKQMKEEDADWSDIVDQLDVMLRRKNDG